MKRIDDWIAAIWGKYGLLGIAQAVLLALLVIVVLALLAWLLGIDVAGMFNDGINALRVNWNS